MSESAACTIIAKNYLAHARALSLSFRQHNPDARMVVLVLDDITQYIDAEKEPFDLVRLEELPIEDLPALCFKYSVLEFSTAIKPIFLQYLFDRHRLRKILYLDPDILVFNTLSPLYELLSDHSILLIPHTTDPIEDEYVPNEVTFLQCGAYNLGFIGVSDTPTTRRMLSWWQARCLKYCLSRPRDGLFVDQKWMDLVPGIFGDAFIVRESGYNVAYWNLHGRKITLDPEPKVNGQPLRFLHFSGYDPERPAVVSKYQTRFVMKGLGEAKRLFSLYRERLLAEGYRDIKRWPYSYGRFDNGTAISPLIRDFYYSLGPNGRVFGNPFSTHHPGSFFEWLNSPAPGEQPQVPYISNLIAYVPKYRDQVMRHSSDDREALLQWLRLGGAGKLELDPIFLEPIFIGQSSSAIGAGHMSYVHVVKRMLRSFFDGSCRVCILLPLLDQWSSRALFRTVSVRLSRSRKDAGSSTNPAIQAGLSARIVKKMLRKVLRPCPRHINLANLLGPTTPTVHRATGRNVVRHRRIVANAGFNIAGYFTTESGVGEAARLMARSVEASGIPHVLIDFEQSYDLRRSDRTFTDFSSDNPYGINLIHVNADQVDIFVQAYGEEFFTGKYNIGFWMWELHDFPMEWSDRFRYFDEIWTASAFSAEAIAKISPISTVKIPLPVVEYGGKLLGRDHFELPLDRFVFFFMFDFMSVFERKNPLAVIEAFKRAFRADDKTTLVLKCSNGNSHPPNAARLRGAVKHPSIHLMEGYLCREEIASLIHACDAYVSLHRSEGFGLTMAEAMSAGKPVIATAYSGNVDFMTVGNSFPVRYHLVEIEKDEGPYRRGSSWAEPEVDHAAELMRWVFEHRESAAQVGMQGKEHVATYFSPEAVGKLVKARVRVIMSRKDAD